MFETSFERVLRHDRAVVIGALTVVCSLAWLYVLMLAADMDMGGMDMTGMRMAVTGLSMMMMPAHEPWSGVEFALTFIMWVTMMVGMMLPSAAPMILLYARVGRTATMRVSPLPRQAALQLDTCWRGADSHLWRRLHSGASSAPCC